MPSRPETPEDLRDRLRVLEQENELLAERAEEISMLGLVAERLDREQDPLALLGAVLEQICILKAIPYGAYLEPETQGLQVRASYCVRGAEAPMDERFELAPDTPWPPPSVLALGAEEIPRWFRSITLQGFPAGPPTLVLLPLSLSSRPGGCLLFAEDRRAKEALAAFLPLLARVADLVRRRLENLALVSRLTFLNANLDLEVAERTEALARSEARYRTLFDHVPDGVLLVDADAAGAIGRIVEANAVAEAMHGYSLEELRQLEVHNLHARGAPGLEEFETRAWRLKPGQTVQEELLHQRKDGSTFPVEAIGILVRLQDRQYVLMFVRDISERKRAEESLLHSQRTESLGVLAGGIAHDFNNLLTAVMGQTSLALSRLDAGSPVSRHLERSLNAAQKAATLTQQMLAYSGRGSFGLGPVALNQLIQENIDFLGSAISKQITFELVLEDGLPPVLADPTQLQQVIMNLVINGSEAIGPKAGMIRIQTRRLWMDEINPSHWPIGGNGLVPGPYVLVEVSDTGCGMSPEVAARMFDPFFTTKAKGHGLGLSAVQGIVRSHRGGLAMQSLLGRGTTFRVLLPAGGTDAQAPKAPGLPGPAVRKTILAIDDETGILDVVQAILALNGHEVHVASSGEEGLACLERHPGQIHLVLLDLTMPGMGGLATLQRLREQAPEVPVVLTSGFAEEEATAQLRTGVLAGFLKKPYLAADLLRIVAATPLPPGMGRE